MRWFARAVERWSGGGDRCGEVMRQASPPETTSALQGESFVAFAVASGVAVVVAALQTFNPAAHSAIFVLAPLLASALRFLGPEVLHDVCDINAWVEAVHRPFRFHSPTLPLSKADKRHVAHRCELPASSSTRVISPHLSPPPLQRSTTLANHRTPATPPHHHSSPPQA